MIGPMSSIKNSAIMQCLLKSQVIGRQTIIDVEFAHTLAWLHLLNHTLLLWPDGVCVNIYRETRRAVLTSLTWVTQMSALAPLPKFLISRVNP